MNQTATLAAPQPRVLADFLVNTRVRDAALVLTAALLTAACAQISIPIPGSPVPVTGQTFAVLLTGAALGANRGSIGGARGNLAVDMTTDVGIARVVYTANPAFRPLAVDTSSRSTPPPG